MLFCRIKMNVIFVKLNELNSNSLGRTFGSRARFSSRITNMEHLKKEKMRSKCSREKKSVGS